MSIQVRGSSYSSGAARPMAPSPPNRQAVARTRASRSARRAAAWPLRGARAREEGGLGVRGRLSAALRFVKLDGWRHLRRKQRSRIHWPPSALMHASAPLSWMVTWEMLPPWDDGAM